MATDEQAKREFFERILVRSGKKTKSVKNDELAALHKTPKKDKVIETPRNLNITADAIHQADVLYLPEDPKTHDKFLLVCVDTGTGKTDAMPMKEVTQKSVTESFKKIFNGKYLKVPKYMQVDAGKEFVGETLKYLNGLKIMVKVAKVARSRQVSYAESRNKSLGGATRADLLVRLTWAVAGVACWVRGATGNN